MREAALTNVLSQLNATSADIQASAVISIDGLMMAALLPAGLDQDRMGAMSAALLSLGARVARELERGTLEQVLVKGDNGYVLMLQAGERRGAHRAGLHAGQARVDLPRRQARGRRHGTGALTWRRTPICTRWSTASWPSWCLQHSRRDTILQALVDHRDWLLAQEDALVALFYDTLYDYPATAAVFVDGERAAREQTLRNWWQRTVGTPIDIDYFRWMAFVGIVHIRRGVTNPMMLSMLQVVSGHVVTSARAALGDRAAVDLQEAFSRISTTVGRRHR
jgi:predicted regulator of Ras-like GTPase activity (Roadblock/LC7/MglB family)